MRPLTRSFMPWLIHTCVYAFMHGFVRSVVYQFAHASMHSFVHSINHSLSQPFSRSLSLAFLRSLVRKRARTHVTAPYIRQFPLGGGRPKTDEPLHRQKIWGCQTKVVGVSDKRFGTFQRHPRSGPSCCGACAPPLSTPLPTALPHCYPLGLQGGGGAHCLNILRHAPPILYPLDTEPCTAALPHCYLLGLQGGGRCSLPKHPAPCPTDTVPTRY